MKLLLKKVTVNNLGSEYHNETVDITVEGNIVKEISDSIDSFDGEVMDLSGATISPGFMDMWSDFADPGFEHRESIASGSHAAIKGGFTKVAVLPNTNPVRDNKSGILYLINNAKSIPVDLLPYCTVSKGGRGDELSEIIDLSRHGAVAFTDVGCTNQADMVLKALKYLQIIDGTLIQRPNEKRLADKGVMNEGVNSTVLGMKGVPALAESLIVQRDTEILRYTGGKIHFVNISSAKSVELIREAKKEGLNVSCSVAVHNLVFDDSALLEYDTNYKFDPPLRTVEDQKALFEGLKDGTIDAINAAHIPHDIESKKLEFDLADFGAISLQTFLPAIISLEKYLPMDLIIDKSTNGPRRVLGLEEVSLATGQDADFVIYDAKQSWHFNESTNQSTSMNSPYFDQILQGKVLGTICKGMSSFK